METTRELIDFCLTLPDVYEDYPFHDHRWAVVRLKGNRKVFAWIFEREGHAWINVKADLEWRDFWRAAFPSVQPAFHLNKKHWNSLIMDGTIPDELVRQMILESYDLVKGKGRSGGRKAAGEKSAAKRRAGRKEKK